MFIFVQIYIHIRYQRKTEDKIRVIKEKYMILY